MNEKECVLELVKSGVLSISEALICLKRCDKSETKAVVVKQEEPVKLTKKVRTMWTTEEEKELKRLFSLGWTAEEISKRMDKTLGSISGKLHRIGSYNIKKGVRRKSRKRENSNKAWTKLDEAKLIKLRNEGVSIAEISKLLQRTAQSIRGRWHLIKTGKIKVNVT